MKDINELALSISEPLDEKDLFPILGGKGGDVASPQDIFNFYAECQVIISPSISTTNCGNQTEQCGQCGQCGQCAKCGQCGS